MDHDSNRHLLAAAVILAIYSGGCASLAHGFRQQIEVDSQPPGARVLVGEKHVGITPVSVSSRVVTRTRLSGWKRKGSSVRSSASNAESASGSHSTSRPV
jgi:hypothetical protein